MNTITTGKLLLANVILDLEDVLIEQTLDETMYLDKEQLIKIIKSLREIKKIFQDVI